jgi:transcriptional regulator of heat shock response
MTDRTAHILEAAIQEFITAGEPVSSGLLYDKYEFGIKPAMIRLELDALEDAGYLAQPHHSAGRVPTNAGYEFYAARMLENAAHDFRARAEASAARIASMRELFEERAWPDLLGRLSGELGLLSVIADAARDEVYKTGLEALVDRLEWQDRDGIRSVIRDFEEFDERLPAAVQNLSAGPHVFIGRKSPITRSDELSVVGGNFDAGDGMTISIFAIGPKRMDYKKVIRMLNNL